MTSMNNVQFLHPHRTPPLFCQSVRIGLNWGRPHHPWTSKLRLPINPTTPIPFGILAAYRLYLVDVSIIYHARATHNSL